MPVDSTFERLDALAIRLAQGDDSATDALSTGEGLYVALAANRSDVLERRGYTIAEALVRLGDAWRETLVARWQCRGNPKHFATGDDNPVAW